jgi:hypothetical protein
MAPTIGERMATNTALAETAHAQMDDPETPPGTSGTMALRKYSAYRKVTTMVVKAELAQS